MSAKVPVPDAISMVRDGDVLDGDEIVVAARDARANFSRMLSNARIDRTRMVITAHSEPAAAIVPIRDLRILNAFDQLNTTDEVAELASAFASKRLSKEQFVKDLSDTLARA